MKSDESSIKRYLATRQIARNQAERDFVSKHPDLVQLMEIGGEYLSGCMLTLSGKSFGDVPHGIYVSDLIISFTRTHFVAVDLLLHGELIEAAVLLRKQFELLARLHELVANEKIEHLVRRTPNLKHLATGLARLYSAYSAIAHSADPIHLEQLGEIEVGGRLWTPIYPVYSGHSRITLQHILLSLVEFHSWAEPCFMSVFADKEYEEFEEKFAAFASAYLRVYPDGSSEDE